MQTGILIYHVDYDCDERLLTSQKCLHVNKINVTSMHVMIMIRWYIPETT